LNAVDGAKTLIVKTCIIEYASDVMSSFFKISQSKEQSTISNDGISSRQVKFEDGIIQNIFLKSEEIEDLGSTRASLIFNNSLSDLPLATFGFHGTKVKTVRSVSQLAE